MPLKKKKKRIVVSFCSRFSGRYNVHTITVILVRELSNLADLECVFCRNGVRILCFLAVAIDTAWGIQIEKHILRLM